MMTEQRASCKTHKSGVGVKTFVLLKNSRTLEVLLNSRRLFLIRMMSFWEPLTVCFRWFSSFISAEDPEVTEDPDKESADTLTSWGRFSMDR